MGNTYYYAMGNGTNDKIQTFVTYSKDAGGYCAVCNVGSYNGNGLFSWYIDSDYFNWYRKPQYRLIVPCGRRSAKNEQAAQALFEQNKERYVREFAEQAESLGAPHMEISAA